MHGEPGRRFHEGLWLLIVRNEMAYLRGAYKLADEGKDSWIEEILSPDTVRTKFVVMGLFLVAHELLIDSIKSRPLSFFANEWDDA